MSKDEHKSAVLWHMNGCVATLYTSDGQKKKPTDTLNFNTKAYLSFLQLNELRIASPAVPFLQTLVSLQLQNNQLTSLPKELWRLEHLQELNLGHNQLTEIPPDVGSLAHLAELYLHNNQIQQMPSQLRRLRDLSILDLTDNQLHCLPVAVRQLDLQRCWLDNNPMDAQPRTSWMSLKAICQQTIGLICQTDEDSRAVLLASEVPEKKTMVPDQLDLVDQCDVCLVPLFHQGLEVVQFDPLPIASKACSQTCFYRLQQANTTLGN
ncbi:hypothetical protein EDC96DRAFT_567732 [Choanephora cucurbitarum]|nr:hypothetical protein EDC96DRAFT_567732 [Choanephora cucurbitarum]